MKFYIKEDRWEDFKNNHKKYGFNIDHNVDYKKYVGNGRDVFVYSYSREIIGVICTRENTATAQRHI